MNLKFWAYLSHWATCKNAGHSFRVTVDDTGRAVITGRCFLLRAKKDMNVDISQCVGCEEKKTGAILY